MTEPICRHCLVMQYRHMGASHPFEPVESKPEVEQELPKWGELAASVCVLTDPERRELNATLLARSGRWIADMQNLHGYREMADKCAALEQERDAAITRADTLQRDLDDLADDIAGAATLQRELTAALLERDAAIALHNQGAARLSAALGRVTELEGKLHESQREYEFQLTRASEGAELLIKLRAQVASVAAAQKEALAVMFESLPIDARTNDQVARYIRSAPLVTDTASEGSSQQRAWEAQWAPDAAKAEEHAAAMRNNAERAPKGACFDEPQQQTSVGVVPAAEQRSKDAASSVAPGGKTTGRCSSYDDNGPCRRLGRPETFRRKSDGQLQDEFMCDEHRGRCNERWESIVDPPTQEGNVAALEQERNHYRLDGVQVRRDLANTKRELSALRTENEALKTQLAELSQYDHYREASAEEINAAFPVKQPPQEAPAETSIAFAGFVPFDDPHTGETLYRQVEPAGTGEKT